MTLQQHCESLSETSRECGDEFHFKRGKLCMHVYMFMTQVSNLTRQLMGRHPGLSPRPSQGLLVHQGRKKKQSPSPTAYTKSACSKPQCSKETAAQPATPTLLRFTKHTGRMVQEAANAEPYSSVMISTSRPAGNY